MKRNPLLSNMVALSPHRTTDRLLSRLVERRRALPSLVIGRESTYVGHKSLMWHAMALISARNDATYYMTTSVSKSKRGASVSNGGANSKSIPPLLYSIKEMVAMDLNMCGFWFSSFIRTYAISLAEQTAHANLEAFIKVHSICTLHFPIINASSFWWADDEMIRNPSGG
jgi:hypothetical protein